MFCVERQNNTLLEVSDQAWDFFEPHVRACGYLLFKPPENTRRFTYNAKKSRLHSPSIHAGVIPGNPAPLLQDNRGRLKSAP